MGSEKRDSVILHLEDFEDLDELTHSEAGKLIKAILAYVSTGVLPENLGVQAKTMFRYIRRHIDRDKASYDETCRKRAAAGKLGGRPKKDADEKQNKAKKANGFSKKQKNPEPEPAPEPEPEPDPDPELDPDPVAPSADGPGDGGSSGLGGDIAERIQFLRTMLRLFDAGALTDAEDRARYADELRELEGGN